MIGHLVIPYGIFVVDFRMKYWSKQCISVVLSAADRSMI